MSRLVPERLLYWNKFGYPDYMLTKYSGSYSDILIHWWFDDSNKADLSEAIEANSKKEAIAEIYKDFIEPDDTKASKSHVQNIEVIAS